MTATHRFPGRLAPHETEQELAMIVGEATALEETMHVEQVARVLPVQGGDQLAAVEFRRCENRGSDPRR